MNRDREAIARIVDPSLWETADRLLALTPDRDLSGTLAASLAKADAILALQPGEWRDRATRAEATEAEGERRRKEMAVEITGLRRSYTDEKVKATRAEAHAERLASIIARGLVMEQAPPYANDMEARRTALRKEARQALSLYRSEMKRQEIPG